MEKKSDNPEGQSELPQLVPVPQEEGDGNDRKPNAMASIHQQLQDWSKKSAVRKEAEMKANGYEMVQENSCCVITILPHLLQGDAQKRERRIRALKKQILPLKENLPCHFFIIDLTQLKDVLPLTFIVMLMDLHKRIKRNSKGACATIPPTKFFTEQCEILGLVRFLNLQEDMKAAKANLFPPSKEPKE